MRATRCSPASTSNGRPLADFPAVESDENPIAPGLATHATAVLSPSRAGYYAPRESSGSFPGFSFDFSVLAYQPSSDPPFPNASTTEEQNALEYIATDVLDLDDPGPSSCYVPAQPDVRSQYCNDKYDTDWSSYSAALRGIAYPSGQAAKFSEATWDAVVGSLSGSSEGGYAEFDAVQNVWNVFNRLQSAYGGAGSTLSAISGAAASDVEKSIVGLETTSATSGVWADIFADVLDTAPIFLPDDPVFALAGLLAGALYLTEDIATTDAGAPTLGPLQIQAGQLDEDLVANLDGATTALANVQEIILTDSAKLQSFDSNSQFDASPEQLTEIVPTLSVAAARFTYEALMPSAYELVRLNQEGRNADVTDANDYVCSSWIKTVRYQPFNFKGKSTAESAQWKPLGRLYVLVLKGQKLPDNSNEAFPETAPKALTDPLFRAPTYQDDVPVDFGFDADVFFPAAYDLTKVPVVNCG